MKAWVSPAHLEYLRPPWHYSFISLAQPHSLFPLLDSWEFSVNALSQEHSFLALSFSVRFCIWEHVLLQLLCHANLDRKPSCWQLISRSNMHKHLVTSVCLPPTIHHATALTLLSLSSFFTFCWATHTSSVSRISLRVGGRAAQQLLSQAILSAKLQHRCLALWRGILW